MAALLGAGCYRWTVIDPRAPVPAADDSGLRITTAAGQATFSPPVRTQVWGDTLVVDSAGQPRRTFSLRQPMDVEVPRYDAARTRWAIFLVACGVAAVAAGALVLRFPGP